jgi:L-aminopeptidase/D-esterase-like protein
MQYLWEAGIGFDAGVARVPIVPGAVLFDLAIGQVAWPDRAMGYAACLAASGEPVSRGCVGAGTGATVGSFLGLQQATKSGIGSASLRVASMTVGAIVAVNAVGNVVDPTNGAIIAGARDPETGQYVGAVQALLSEGTSAARPGTHTTIGVIATDADLTADEVWYLARVAHDGLARTIHPVHTMADGDTLFALATGRVRPVGEQYVLRLGVAAVQAVERAVLDAVMSAEPLCGLPAARRDDV